MRDTQRSLAISGGLFVAGAALTAIGAWLHEIEGETLGSGLSFFVGLMIAPGALIWFISSAVSGRRKVSLETGSGEIARWRLSAAEWAAFRAQERRFMAEGRGVNMLSMRDGPPADGEIVFARRGVIVDGDYQDLTPGGLIDLRGVEWVSGNPRCLEFHMIARRTGGASGTDFGANHMWLRVPVGGDDGREATKAFAHFSKTTRRSPPLAMINPRLTINICFGIAAACAIAAIWGFANRTTQAYGDAPLYAAVIGVIAGGGALILAAIARSAVPGRRR